MYWPISNNTIQGAIVDNQQRLLFKDRDLINNVPGTQVSAVFLNMLLAELLNALDHANIVPNVDDNTQVMASLFRLFGNTGALSATGYAQIPFYGAAAPMIMQFVRGNVDAIGSGDVFTEYNWPIAFPNNCFLALASADILKAGQNAGVLYQVAGVTPTQVGVQRTCTANGDTSSSQANILAFGV